MGTDLGSFGLIGNVAVELPAICIGHPLQSGCSNEGTVLLTTLLDDHGAPRPVIVTACPKHASVVAHWLSEQGRGDPVDRWATRTFFEHAHVIEDLELDFWRLQRASA